MICSDQVSISFCIHMLTRWFGNKAKGRISKRVFQENKARQIFRKKNLSDPLIHHLLVHIRGKKCLVFEKLNVLCFLETPVLIFTLLPYCWHKTYLAITKTNVYWSQSLIEDRQMSESFTQIRNKKRTIIPIEKPFEIKIPHELSCRTKPSSQPYFLRCSKIHQSYKMGQTMVFQADKKLHNWGY